MRSNHIMSGLWGLELSLQKEVGRGLMPNRLNIGLQDHLLKDGQQFWSPILTGLLVIQQFLSVNNSYLPSGDYSAILTGQYWSIILRVIKLSYIVREMLVFLTIG